jgi:hypothetical protein
VIQLAGGWENKIHWQDGPVIAESPRIVWAFVITPVTVVTDDIKVGIRVIIRYTEGGRGESPQRSAVSINRLEEWNRAGEIMERNSSKKYGRTPIGMDRQLPQLDIPLLDGIPD